MAYVDLVLCKHPNNDGLFLFYAPAWSRLKKGGQVIVNTQKGESLAIVQDCVTVDNETNEYKFIVELANAKLPLKKVLSKVVYDKFEYEEEDENGID